MEDRSTRKTNDLVLKENTRRVRLDEMQIRSESKNAKTRRRGEYLVTFEVENL